MATIKITNMIEAIIENVSEIERKTETKIVKGIIKITMSAGAEYAYVYIKSHYRFLCYFHKIINSLALVNLQNVLLCALKEFLDYLIWKKNPINFNDPPIIIMYLFWENIWFNLCKISVLKGSKCSYSSLILKYVNYGTLTKQPNIMAILLVAFLSGLFWQSFDGAVSSDHRHLYGVINCAALCGFNVV